MNQPLTEYRLPADARARAEAAATADTIRRRLAELQAMPVSALQALYYELHGRATRSHNRAWLLKRLSYKTQELLTGLTLSAQARQRIAKLGAKEPVRRWAPQRALSDFERSLQEEVERAVTERTRGLTPPKVKPRDPRLPPAGTIIRRSHREQVHEIHVLEEGFEYQGRHYTKLSHIAKEVTGTKWNGFIWAGLSKRKRKAKTGPTPQRPEGP